MSAVGVFLLVSCALLSPALPANIGDIEWVNGGFRVNMATEYAATPQPRTLVVAGFGNCAVQMPDTWQMHLFDPDTPAPTGNCDTWVTDQSPSGIGEDHYFGTDSLQPHHSHYPSLAVSDTLYGFNSLPGQQHDPAQQNRLYISPATAVGNSVQWHFSGDATITYTTNSMSLPLAVSLQSSYNQLTSCSKFGGSPVLSVSQSNGQTTYSFGVYLLSLIQDTEYSAGSGKLKSTCVHRQFTHSVRSTVTATWGGFTSTDDATPTYTPVGVMASYLLTLIVDPIEAASAFQDEQVIIALEVQILVTLQSLQADDWTLDLTVDDPYLVTSRRSTGTDVTYRVPFSAIYTMLNNGTAFSDVAMMGSVLRHVVATAYSNTPNFKQHFVDQWRERYINATGNPWPLPSVQLSDPPFMLTLPGPDYVTTMTAPPTPAPGPPTPAPGPPPPSDPQDSESAPLAAIIGGVVGGTFVCIGVIVTVWYCKKQARPGQGGTKYGPL